MTAAPLDPAKVMAAHNGPLFADGFCLECDTKWPCVTYRLASDLDEEREVRKANSQSARRLMDAIRSDPAFPPDDDPMLFGDQALVVIEAMRKHFHDVDALREALRLQVLDLLTQRDRLAAELAIAQGACETMGEIIDRQAVDICKIAGVPMPEDGDADYELAWSRVRQMAAELAAAQATGRLAESGESS